MTDNDAKILRHLVNKNGLSNVIAELYRIAKSWAEQVPPVYGPASKAIKLAHWRLNHMKNQG